MIRGTTPTIKITLVTTLDISKASELYVTFKTTTATVTKALSDVSVAENVITVTLTQEDTLDLHSGKVEVQVRFKIADEDGTEKAYASDITSLSVGRVLKEGAI